MAKMPTTREGRFKFYKARAKRRWATVRRRKDYSGASAEGQGRYGSRPVDTTGTFLQEPRVYPRHPYGDGMPAVEWLLRSWTPPRRGAWGVVRDLTSRPDAWGFNTHRQEPRVHYHLRRVHYLPRLKHLPVLPYRFPINATTLPRLWPFPFYPSGRPNAHYQGP